MSRRNLIVGFMLLVAFGLGAGAGTLGILYGTGRLTEESQDIQDVVPTLSLDVEPTVRPELLLATQIADVNANLEGISEQLNANSEQIAALGTVIADASIQSASAEATEEVEEPTATQEPVSEAMPEATEETSEAGEEAVVAADVPERALYRITQDESLVRFLIDEILVGEAFTVEGTTRRVAGDVIVNFADPSASQVGPIAINARTLKTDNEFRDQSVRGHILETDTYEFINFTPTEFISLTTDPVGVGGTAQFQIVGDLTIKDVTRSVTFEVTVTVASEERIEGTASVVVLYEDFGIIINPPPTVGGIGEEVTLQIDFVALRVDA